MLLIILLIVLLLAVVPAWPQLFWHYWGAFKGGDALLSVLSGWHLKPGPSDSVAEVHV